MSTRDQHSFLKYFGAIRVVAGGALEKLVYKKTKGPCPVKKNNAKFCIGKFDRGIDKKGIVLGVPIGCNMFPGSEWD